MGVGGSLLTPTAALGEWEPSGSTAKKDLHTELISHRRLIRRQGLNEISFRYHQKFVDEKAKQRVLQDRNLRLAGTIGPIWLALMSKVLKL
jgi:hypothetical protein